MSDWPRDIEVDDRMPPGMILIVDKDLMRAARQFYYEQRPDLVEELIRVNPDKITRIEVDRPR
jgi:hypothetical protein